MQVSSGSLALGSLAFGDIAGNTAPPGLTRIGGGNRPALLFVPDGVALDAMPLLVFFHGAGGTPENSVDLVVPYASAKGVAVLAPASSDYTWDVIVSEPGPDVTNLHQRLAEVAGRVHVDGGRVAFGGFSDGASYALTLGLANPDVAKAVMAFSPGFFLDGQPHVRPPCFVSHGTRDNVLPIDRTSRMMLPRLRDSGYPVEYFEFDGGHTVPVGAAQRAFDWWLAESR